MLTNKQILELAEQAGFEFNDYGKWNCSTDAIIELIAEIESHYGIGADGPKYTFSMGVKNHAGR